MKTNAQAAYEAKQIGWEPQPPWESLSEADQRFWFNASEAAIGNLRSELRAAISKKLAADMSPEEWCDYWRQENPQFIADNLSLLELRADLASASERLMEFICILRGWDYEQAKHMTFTEIHDSYAQHIDAVIQATRE